MRLARGAWSGVTDFLLRLRRRKIVQWALAYVAGAFALIQVVDIIGQRFGWPAEVMRGGIVALAVGFFVVLVLAWYHGERGAQRVSGVELVILAMLFAIGGLVLSHVAKGPAVAPDSTATHDAALETPRISGALPIQAKSIAVLPFENLSADKDNAYFAGGMRDEILTRLAGIHDLKVISRTSTEQYGSHPADIKTVAAQLGVAAVLEGSVQKAGDFGAHQRAADRYAQRFASLGRKLRSRSQEYLRGRARRRRKSDPTRCRRNCCRTKLRAWPVCRPKTPKRTTFFCVASRTTTAPTTNIFSPTRRYRRRFGCSRKRLTKIRTSRLPPSALSKAHSYMYWFGPDRTEARLTAAKAVADRALALKPDLGDAHYALAMFYYWGHRDYASARHELQLARETLPNNSEVELSDAAISRRLGQFDDAIAGFKRAAELAPQSASPSFNLGQIYMIRRQYAEADRYFASAAAVMPIPI